ncbi:ABC transporter substrate-binding protein [Brevibacillus marinus]|uniref:ABC transporter substrate-binding protein n=1 Tax=Brevibacillus marinus TaxID=2496837 RepID=UPI000F84D3FB|nr:ABC transporter substrate-binding protein [Brevibacillus marinus]
MKPTYFRFLTAALAKTMLFLLCACSFGGASSVESAAGDTRLYTDALGRKVAVPVHPERVVVQQFYAEMLALGIEMVGTNKTQSADMTVAKEMLADVEDIGNIFAGLEKVASLEADLIVVPEYLERAVLDNLAKIAPTVVVNYSDSMYSRLRAIGALFGKSDEAEAWIQAYEAKAAQTKERLASVVRPGETISAFILYHDKQLYVYGNQMIGATLYGTLGFAPPPKLKELIAGNPSELWYTISPETLPDYAGDYVMIITPNGDPAAEQETSALMNGPVWRSIPAVVNGRAIALDYKWAFYDPLTMERLLDELALKLTGGSGRESKTIDAKGG